MVVCCQEACYQNTKHHWTMPPRQETAKKIFSHVCRDLKFIRTFNISSIDAGKLSSQGFAGWNLLFLASGDDLQSASLAVLPGDLCI